MTIDMNEFAEALKTVAEQAKNEPDTATEFPPDFSDTYELGVKHGKLKSLRFIIGIMEKYVESN